MEKQMSVDERIRRAEERYNNKNGYKRYKNETNKGNYSKKKKTKLITQIFVCLIIYAIFYGIWNWDYVFSENFRNDISTRFNNIKSYIESNILHTDVEEQNSEDETIDEKDTQENTEATENIEEESTEGVGGSTEDVGETQTSELSEEEQMEQDADTIKQTISFIVPVEGTITSTFGWRDSTISTVSKYHTGLDIAATLGTVIKSATSGTVILASSQGDYGNHYKIQIDDVIIIYAHCKKLYLEEGDTVSQGQEIAEVGSTGNSTGPHLHFEIRKDGRLVDPQLILDI